MKTDKFQRLEYLDVAKGLLIFLMVWGHVYTDGPLFQYIYSFHMPAFFMISGLLFHYSESIKKPILIVLKNKLCSLILPLLFFELFGVLADILRFGITLNVFGYAFNTLTLDCNNGPSWFLWVLFVDEMIFFILRNLINSEFISCAGSALVGLLLILCDDVFYLQESTGVGLLFLVAGYYLKDFLTQPGNVKTLCIALVISLLSNYMNGLTGLGSGNFGNNVILYIIAAVAGTLMIIQLSTFITSKLIRYYGKNTLTIVGTHQTILLPARTFFHYEVFPLPVGIGMFTLTLLLEIPLIYLLNKYVPLFVGKKRPKSPWENLLCLPAYAMVPMVVMLWLLIRMGLWR